MYCQTNLPGIPSATSSPALASGATPCAAPAGPMIALSGPDPALASLSARQAKERGLLTSGTSGQPGSTSSASAALASSLASRLQARTRSLGSTLFTLTWKQRVTPSGLSISALRASVRRISDNDFGSWPTPRASEGGPDFAIAQRSGATCRFPTVAQLTGWPTPTATLADKAVRTQEGGIKEAMRGHGPDLAAVSCLSMPYPPPRWEAGSRRARATGRTQRA